MRKNPKKTFIGGLVIGTVIGMMLGGILMANYIINQIA